MKNLIEWFFSLFVKEDDIKRLKTSEANKMREELLEYQNKIYFNKLRRKCR